MASRPKQVLDPQTNLPKSVPISELTFQFFQTFTKSIRGNMTLHFKHVVYVQPLRLDNGRGSRR